MRDLESLGVQVWTGAKVTGVTNDGVLIGNEKIAASTVLWAAGVKAADVGKTLGMEVDGSGRVPVGPDLTIPGHPEVFVVGDMSRALNAEGKPLPGVALVAMQQGWYVADLIKRELADKGGGARKPFAYHDLGQMATIGRSRAIAEFGKLRLSGGFAWWFWLIVHIYRLSGFRNRLTVVIHWAWSYLTFTRGARLIVGKEWRAYPEKDPAESSAPGAQLSRGNS
jgi:NADH dehydrogenase